MKEAGEYTCEAVVSSGTTGSKFTVARVKGSQRSTLCTINVPQTGNNTWGTYKSVTEKLKLKLSEGEQVIRVTITGAQCNIDKLIFTCTSGTGIDEVQDSGFMVQDSEYNVAGQKVGADYRGIVIKNGRKILKK